MKSIALLLVVALAAFASAAEVDTVTVAAAAVATDASVEAAAVATDLADDADEAEDEVEELSAEEIMDEAEELELDEDAVEDEEEAEEAEEDASADSLMEVEASKLNIAVDNFAAVDARKCAAASLASLKCTDGSKVFAKITRPGAYNGCGPDGNKILNDATLGGTFSPCCNQHDLCYGSSKSNKDKCDTSFYNCMKSLCKNALCNGKAWTYYEAVSQFGCSAWKNAKLNQGCLSGKTQTNAKTAATAAQTAAAAKFFTSAYSK